MDNSSYFLSQIAFLKKCICRLNTEIGSGGGGGSETLQQAFDASITTGDNPQIETTSEINIISNTVALDGSSSIAFQGLEMYLIAQSDDGLLGGINIISPNVNINAALRIHIDSPLYVLQSIKYAFPSSQGTDGQVLGIDSVDGTGKAILSWKDVAGGSPVLFGEDDVIALADRAFDLDSHSFAFNTSNEFTINNKDGNSYITFQQGYNQLYAADDNDDNRNADLQVGSNKGLSFYHNLDVSEEDYAYLFLDASHGGAGGEHAGIRTNGQFRLVGGSIKFERNDGITDYALLLPDSYTGDDERYIPITVNGNFADNTGNITVAGGGSSRFGVSGEDDVLTQPRRVNFGDQSFLFSRLSDDATVIILNQNQLEILDPDSGNTIEYQVDRITYFISTTGTTLNLDYPLSPDSDTEYTIPVTVNGIVADSVGNINVVKTTDNFANDGAAAIGGILVGGLYHTAGVVKIRLT